MNKLFWTVFVFSFTTITAAPSQEAKNQASRWSDDKLFVGKEGEIYQQGSLLADFFIRKMEPFLQRIRMGDFIQRMGEGRREGDQFASIEPWKVLTSKLKANVNVSLSGAWLAGSAATDFKSVINKLSVGEPQDVNVDLIVKIENFAVKARMTGEFTSLFEAFTKLASPPPQNATDQENVFVFLDLFDGPFHIIEQSIIGDVKATYKKIKPFIKWMYINIENQSGPDEDYKWSTYGGEKIKVEAKLKLSVGDVNSADIEFKGEATEAAKTFVNNGYLDALDGKMEICVDKECKKAEWKGLSVV